MCSSDFATVGAEIPIFWAVVGIETMGLRCMCWNAQHRGGMPAQSFNPALVLFEQRNDATRSACSLIRRLFHAGEKEFEPNLPIALSADAI